MEKDIGKITKKDDTEIVLRIDDFADKRGFTIREFVTSERYTGFTKSGVRILAKDWQKFKEMINSVDDEDMKDTGPVEEQVAWEEPPKEEPEEEGPKVPEPPKEEVPTIEEEPVKEAPSKEELPDY